MLSDIAFHQAAPDISYLAILLFYTIGFSAVPPVVLLFQLSIPGYFPNSSRISITDKESRDKLKYHTQKEGLFEGPP